MLTRQRCITVLLLAVVAIGPATAQDAQQRVDAAATPSVTAAASGRDLRFTAPGAVVQIRLEVFSPEGERVFDSGDKPGNVLDWRTQEQQGALHGEASYLCTVTVRDLSSRLSQRHGLISLSAGRVSFRRAERDQLTPAQVQAWEGSRLAHSLEPVAQDADSLAILLEGATPTLTALAHDGTDGQVTRTRGAFSFRFGDFFTGNDTEQMRLTEEGNLGIGTSKPKAKLDVVGMISAREGLMFADGSTLNVNDKGVLTRTTAGGEIVPNVAGTGTQNRLPKWSETGGAGTLADSALFEAGGQLGVGTTTPNPNAVVHADRSQNTGTTLFVTNSNAGSVALASMRAGLNPANFAVDYASLNILGANWPAGLGGALLKGKTVLIEGAGSNLAIGNINASEPILFYTTASRLERMRITSGGNVGIGTSSPNAATKLDVVGDINTSTQYRIGGNRVFSIPGFDNTFAGSDAGVANTTGSSNSFFGSRAGLRNTGGANSFFGANAGLANTTATFNSFFGAGAGAANTTGASNSFFGGSAGRVNTTGASNSFFGALAGFANMTGASNSFFGASAGAANTTGNLNSFFGASAGRSNTGGGSNSFFGKHAGNANTTGGANSFFGKDAGFANTTACCNSFFGTSAGASNTTATSNSFFGKEAGVANTTGGSNSFFGANAGAANRTGAANSFFGRNAGAGNTTGAANSFFGRNAGDANTSGESNIVIGNSAGGNLTTGSNNIYLGSSPALNESNAIRIGTEGIQTTAFIAGISGNSVAAASGTAVFVDANGRLGTILSSRRFKQNIRAMGNASGKLMQLRPVTFLYKPEVVQGEQTLQYGLIAEEVAKIYPDLVQYAADGKPQTVRYHLLNPILLNEVQKQRRQIESQAQQLQSQTQRIANQTQRLQSQAKQMTQQAQQINALEIRLRRLETRTRRRQTP